MTGPSSEAEMRSLEELEEAITRALAAVEAEAAQPYPDIPNETLLWVALAPSWTAELAEAVGLPRAGASAAATLERLREVRLVEVVPSGPWLPGVTVYRMPSASRSWVLNRYRDPAGGGAAPPLEIEVRRTLTKIGSRLMDRVRAAPDSVPGPIARWAALAEHGDDVAAMARILDDAVAEASARTDASAIDGWIDAARPLAALLLHYLEDGLDLALQRADRRLELLHRHEADRRHLRSYLPQEELAAALTALLADDGEHWALHFIGQGGVGKTMMLRYAATELLPGAATARIDFDYLNPDFPSLAPGLLLWAFAQDLRAHDFTDPATRYLDRANELLRDLHERLRAERVAGRRATDDPQFRSALQLYIDGLHALARPVVLLIDTCEELARIGADGTTPKNVEETFRILRALHDGPGTLDDPAMPSFGVTGLRVVFAGRRLLASSGEGWHTDPPLPLPPRPYLRVHEVRGLPISQAERYVREVRRGLDGLCLVSRLKPEELRRQGGVLVPVPAELEQPVIRRSRPDPGGAPGLVWDDPGAVPARELCHPYDLQLYCAWATEQPPPTAAEIEAETGDQFVELRILRRLRMPALEPLLPLIALVGSFDRRLLRAVSDADDTAFEVALASLSSQEWITRRYAVVEAGEQARMVLGVQAEVLERLRSYFDARGGVPRAQLARAADHLTRETLEGDLAALDWVVFDAALRVLEQSNAAETRRWWADVERRIGSERDQEWVQRLTGSLAGPDGAAARRDPALLPYAPPESRLRAAVLATHATALRQTGRFGDLEIVWREVIEKAGAEPDAEAGRRLMLRGLAGALAAVDPAFTPSRELVEELWRYVEERGRAWDASEEIAALVAAVEALVEHAERAPDGQAAARTLLRDGLGPLWAVEVVEASLPGWRQRAPAEQHADLDELAAFACALAGRTEALRGSPTSAHEWFRNAIRRAPRGSTRRWRDWQSPDDLGARLRLELIRTLYPAALGPAAVLRDIEGEARTDPSTADGRCFTAAVALLNGAIGPPAVPRSSAVPPRLAPATCNAHRSVPDLLAVTGEDLAGSGRVDRALGLVLAPGADLDERRDADRSLLRIARRWHLRDETLALESSLAKSAFLGDRAIVWALDGLDGQRRSPADRGVPAEVTDPAERAAWQHEIWRTTFALDPGRATAAVGWAGEHLRPELHADLPELARLSIALDRREAAALAGPKPRRAERDALPDGLWRRHPTQPEAVLRLLVRGPEPDIPGELVARLGLRRAAEIALEEGQLLALRLPADAVALLDTATRWFEDCDDAAGVVIAGVATMIARGRAQGVDELKAALARVRIAYERLRAAPDAQEGLPDWAGLVTMAAAGDSDGLARLPLGWRPVLARVVLCLKRRSDLASAEPDSPPVPDVVWRWLEGTYGLESSAGVAMPADLAGWPEKPVTEAREPERPWTTLDRVADVLSTGLGIVLGIVILIAGFVGFQWLVGHVPAMAGLNAGWQLLLYVVVLGLLSLLVSGTPGGVRAFAAAVADVMLVDLRISRVREGAPGEPAPAAVTLATRVSTPRLVPLRLPPLLPLRDFAAAVWSTLESPLITGLVTVPAALLVRRRLGLTQPRRADVFAAPSGLTPLAPYAALARRLPQELQPGYTSLFSTLEPGLPGVRIEVPEGQHGLCWEALVAAHLAPNQRLPFRFRRVGPSRGRPVAVRVARPGVYGWARRAGAETLILRAWHGRQRVEASVKRELQSEPPWPPSKVRVLHMIGTVEETSAGLLFHVADDAGRRSRTGDNPAAPASVSDVFRTFDHLTACVIQGEPGPLGPRRESDRRYASLARAFAAELYARGVAVVIVVPPLELGPATDVASTLAAALSRRAAGATWRMVHAVAKARALVLAASDWEAAMDLCLYCPGDWDGRL